MRREASDFSGETRRDRAGSRNAFQGSALSGRPGMRHQRQPARRAGEREFPWSPRWPRRLERCVTTPASGVTVAPNPTAPPTPTATTGIPAPSTPAPPRAPLPSHAGARRRAVRRSHACTFAMLPFAGTCGTPVVCNDFNPCTTDTCDPATGALPVDANRLRRCQSCTVDSSPGDRRLLLRAAARSSVRRPAISDDRRHLPDGSGTADDPARGHPPARTAIRAPTTSATRPPARASIRRSRRRRQPVPVDSAHGRDLSVRAGGRGRRVVHDGIPATNGDTCVPGPERQSRLRRAAAPCDDFNPCTSIRRPAIGALHAHRAGIGDVTGLRFTGSTSRTGSRARAQYWKRIAGTIPQNMMGSRGAAGTLYARTCFEQATRTTTGSLVSHRHAESPARHRLLLPGLEFVNCGEGPIGRDLNHSMIRRVALFRPSEQID